MLFFCLLAWNAVFVWHGKLGKDSLKQIDFNTLGENQLWTDLSK